LAIGALVESVTSKENAELYAEALRRGGAIVTIKVSDSDEAKYALSWTSRLSTSQHAIVEVLDEEGRPCEPGHKGRVVVTDLHNFAIPLIRYDIGDYAEPGQPCTFGRGLPTLALLYGRQRSLILMPDEGGTGRLWDSIASALAPIRQYQFFQTGRKEIEVRLSVERPLSGSEQETLAAHIRGSLGYPFRLTFVYFDGTIAREARGKFEEFICRAKHCDFSKTAGSWKFCIR
jgi:phenylacetate-coenzyme A ligase PaaK-like adenylate-forming protein